MNTKKVLAVCSAVCMVLGMGLFQTAHAWFVDTNVDVNANDSSRNTNSRNTDSRGSNNRDERGSRNNNSINMQNGRYTSASGSYNRYSTDNRKDSSIRNTDSFNTDARSFDYSDRSSTSIDSSDNRKDSSIKDSFNDSRDMSDHSVGKVTEMIGRDKRVDSDDMTVSAGDIRNSVVGDFGQTYTGTDIRSGVTGSGNTIDASSVNLTTFGDTTTLKAPDTTTAK